MAVHVSVAGSVASVVLDRPAVNAFDGKQLEELECAAEDVLGRDGVRVIVLSATGERAFSAGADLRAVTALVQEGELRSWLGLAHRVLDRIAGSPVPWIAAIERPAVGGGFELALACQLRTLGRGAHLALPEIERGYLPSWAALERLCSLVGRGVTTDLVLTGRHVGPSEALALGLVHRIGDDALAEARLLAERVAAMPPLAIRAALGQLALLDPVAPSAAFRQRELEDVERLVRTEDTAEGLMAFFEKRPPAFRGR